MGILLLGIGLLTVSGARAAELVKTCATEFRLPDASSGIPTRFQFYREEPGYRVHYTQSFDGVEWPATEPAQLREFAVRGDLTPDTAPDGLNDAEKLLVLAMDYYRGYRGSDDVRIDFSKVKRAKVYSVGREPGPEASSVVDAFDAQGRLLGSFFGGRIVVPCRPQ